MKPQIRPYEEGDQEKIIQLILPIQQQEFGVSITIADQPDLQSVSTFYQHAHGNFWVATHGDDIVGTIALLNIGNGQGVIRKMFVRSDYRGAALGIAQQLLDALVNWCPTKQIDEIFLGTIDTMKAAHRFYEKNGFYSIEKEMLPATFPLMRVDNRFYQRVLRPSTRIFHITPSTHWKTFADHSRYSTSSLAHEGFIHCSTHEQIAGTLHRFFTDQRDLVLLHIEPSLLQHALKYEESDGKLFPHVYGVINRDAIVRVEVLRFQ
ncbi:MAG: GNAT family N-acetyltransferase [Bacteroidetes bacterium]|nr:GNAT family N-acetyltransferase [Bacteroidota bacterium]